MVVVAVGSTLSTAVVVVAPVVSVCVKDGGPPGWVDVDDNDNDARGDGKAGVVIGVCAAGEDDVVVAGCRGEL